MTKILLADFGSTFTKTCAVDLESEKIIAQYKTATTVETDIIEGFNLAKKELLKQAQIKDFDLSFASSSAGGGLKIIAIGLVPDLTLAASKMAAYNAGAKIIGTYSYELSDYDIDEIDESDTDLVLFTGGTDGGNKKIVLKNAEMLASAKSNFTVIVACNRVVKAQVAKILEKTNKKVVLSENVMPKIEELNILHARESIRKVFLKDIVKSKGLASVLDIIEGDLLPTPSVVMNAIEVLSKGTKNEEGIGEILAFDIGGATTDVYSASKGEPDDGNVIFKGFKEPFIKRTVEGDLGLRYNADSIIDESGLVNIIDKSGLGEERIDEIIKNIKNNPSYISQKDDEINLDNILAKEAIYLSSKRHAGTIKKVYTSNGEVFVQTGKNLKNVKTILGTGGPIISLDEAKTKLEKALFSDEDYESLRPVEAEFLIDKKYILSAMGILSQKYPDIALKIMKKELKKT